MFISRLHHRRNGVRYGYHVLLLKAVSTSLLPFLRIKGNIPDTSVVVVVFIIIVVVLILESSASPSASFAASATPVVSSSAPSIPEMSTRYIFVIEITATQNEVALNYHRVRG